MKLALICICTLFICTNSYSQPAYVFHEKGEEKFKSENYADAIKDFDQAIKASVQNFDSYLMRGKCFEKLGNIKAAIENYNLAIKYNPNYTDAYFSLALIEANGKDEKSALSDFAMVLKLNPNYLEVYNRRGQMYMLSGKTEAAMKDFTKAIELNTSNPEVYIQMGKMAEKEQKSTVAIEYYSKGIELKPTYANTYYERGALYYSQKKYKEALIDFSSAVSKGFQSEQLLHFRSKCYAILGNENNAYTDLCSLIDVYKSKDANVYIQRALIFRKKNDAIHALKDFSKAIQYDNQNGQIYLERGHLYMLQGKSKIPLAMQDYQKAEELKITDFSMFVNRAKYEFETQKFELARHDFTEAIHINPEADLFYKRSMCNFKLGNKKECCEDIKKAASMGHAEAKKDIGAICK